MDDGLGIDLGFEREIFVRRIDFRLFHLINSIDVAA